MKSGIRTSSIRTIALATLVSIASLSQTLHAQITSPAARVDVPFSFDYGTTHFSSGVYILTMNGQNLLTVRHYDRAATAMVRADWSMTPARTSVVIFKKYGDRYFLEQVREAGAVTHIDVLQSQAEKRATRELASRGTEATQIALALLPERTNGN
jgi:hypothetical protein